MKAGLSGLALLLAGCATTAPAADDAGVRSATLAFYAPFQAAAEPAADWDRPIFTVGTARLIAAWRAVQTDGEPVDGLGDAGWLCECQDWDSAAFGVTITAITHPSPGVARVSLIIRQGWGSETTQDLLLRREQGRWLIDDLFAVEDAPGLRRQLRAAVQ